MSEESASLTLTQAVQAFLELAMTHPETPPRTQRQERDNTMTIIGFNQAQEQLRHILKVHGRTKAIRDLAGVRNDQQQRPMEVGDSKLWVAS